MTDNVEGDPVTLAEARTATFRDGKVIVCSTPTLEGGSPIWALYEEGTRFRWSWPCPDCRAYFVPRFELLKWPEGCSPHRALKEARLVCPECASLIEDVHKAEMNRRGLFLTEDQTLSPDGKRKGEDTAASFWISGLCSPWRTFGQRAKAFLEASRSRIPGRTQAVINTGFGFVGPQGKMGGLTPPVKAPGYGDGESEEKPVNGKYQQPCKRSTMLESR